jgi:hypothetical protein
MIVNTPEDASKFLLDKIKDLEFKLDQTLAVPEKLIPYEFPPILVNNICHIHNSGTYNYNYNHDMITSLQAVLDRRDALLKHLDEAENSANEVKEKNKKIIEHNLAIHKKVSVMMESLGVRPTTSIPDPKSRARIPKRINQVAGYKTDLMAAVPIMDNLSIFNTIASKRAAVSNWAVSTTKKIQEKEREENKIKIQEENLHKLAVLKVKYNMDAMASKEDILDAILSSDKYLRLAYFLLANRNDWSEGYSLAETGLDGFEIQSDEDKEIYKCLNDILTDEDPDYDGRVFRDCEWNYGVLFAKVSPELRADYEIINNMIESH